MTRLRATLCAVALPIVVWSFAGVAAAAEPEPDAPKAGELPNFGGFEKSIPLAIGGGITVGVLWVGFLVLNAKKPQRAQSFDQQMDPDHLPADVVGSPSPLRYFVLPVLFVALLAVGIPLGYSIWKSLPDTPLIMPPKGALQPVPIDFQPSPVDYTKFKFVPIPAPPAIHVPPYTPPPVRVPVVTPPRIGR
jgi:hypothetical protein